MHHVNAVIDTNPQDKRQHDKIQWCQADLQQRHDTGHQNGSAQSRQQGDQGVSQIPKIDHQSDEGHHGQVHRQQQRDIQGVRPGPHHVTDEAGDHQRRDQGEQFLSRPQKVEQQQQADGRQRVHGDVRPGFSKLPRRFVVLNRNAGDVRHHGSDVFDEGGQSRTVPDVVSRIDLQQPLFPAVCLPIQPMAPGGRQFGDLHLIEAGGAAHTLKLVQQRSGQQVLVGRQDVLTDRRRQRFHAIEEPVEPFCRCGGARVMRRFDSTIQTIQFRTDLPGRNPSECRDFGRHAANQLPNLSDAGRSPGIRRIGKITGQFLDVTDGRKPGELFGKIQSLTA